MRVKKQKAPICLLMVYCDDDKGEKVEKYLDENNLKSGIVFMGEGTSESDIADMFGFGMIERDIIACIVPAEKSEQILDDVKDIIGIDKGRAGMAMLIPMSSATTTILDSVVMEDGDGNDK